jgi:hypothetical protein
MSVIVIARESAVFIVGETPRTGSAPAAVAASIVPAASALAAQSRVAAAIRSPQNLPLRNLLFREVIITYSLYEFENIVPKSTRKAYP